MQGYYKTSNGTKTDLGQHVFATPGVQRGMADVRLPGHPTRWHAQDGGVMQLEVTAQRQRSNLGDAEWWAYSRLRELVLAQKGLLAVSDALGNEHAFADAVMVSAEARVDAYELATLTLDMQCGESSSDAAYGTPPIEPATRAGTSTSQDYTANGVSLGVGGKMQFEAYRDTRIRPIPRARGARVSLPKAGGEMRIIITADLVADGSNIADQVEALARSISGQTLTISANGNEYTECLLADVRSQHTDWRNTTLDWTFLQDLASVNVASTTTTTTTSAA